MDECCVCMSETENKTPCDHTLCKQCWKQLRKFTCPMCRRDIPEMINWYEKIGRYFFDQPDHIQSYCAVVIFVCLIRILSSVKNSTAIIWVTTSLFVYWISRRSHYSFILMVLLTLIVILANLFLNGNSFKSNLIFLFIICLYIALFRKIIYVPLSVILLFEIDKIARMKVKMH